MRKQVLVVAPQMELRGRVARLLRSTGYVVEVAEGQKRALELARTGNIDAAVVVSGSSPASLVPELRAIVPRTIVLGDRTNEIVRRRRMPGGADEHSLGTLDEQNLLDRLERMMAPQAGVGDETASMPVILKLEGRTVDLTELTFVDSDGHEKRLTRAEAAVLALFARSPRRVVSRDRLRHAVSGNSTEPHDRSVDMLIARLRRKIEPDPKAPRFILTVPGVGYKCAALMQGAETDKSQPPIDAQHPIMARSAELNRRSAREEATPTSVAAVAMPYSEPERRQLTVLSCGVLGSSIFGANLDPEDLNDFVRRFQDDCTKIISHWGGAVINTVCGEVRRPNCMRSPAGSALSRYVDQRPENAILRREVD